MNIEKQTRVEYVLRLDYNELHSLYHMFLDMQRSGMLTTDTAEHDLYIALKEHA